MAGAPPKRRLPLAIWAVGGVSLLADIASEMVHSLLPVFLVSGLGASYAMVGWLEGAAEATALIVKVFSGVLSDRLGRRKPLALLGYGLGAASKPLFALASTVDTVLAARLIDRVGKGLRGAPRDAMVADLAPPGLRGAAFGLRQSLDTVGSFLGPLLAIGLMLLWANDFRAVFWAAVLPGALSVLLLALGVPETAPAVLKPPGNPISRAQLRRLGLAYWWVVGIGAALTLARFSEAFLVLRIVQGGLALAWAPLVLVAMNVVFTAGAYPFGRLSDRIGGRPLLAAGLLLLIAADLLLALGGDWAWAGVLVWGLHMALTQGLLAAMVADSAPAELRGTAFGLFNLLSGLAMLLASGLAGWLWDSHGAPATFLAGAAFSALALLLVGAGRPLTAGRGAPR